MLKRVVNALELVALLAAATFVVLLFAYRPTAKPAAPAAAAANPLVVGEQVFAANCSTCHGAHGEGAVGPRLSGGAVVRRYPNPADQIAVVEYTRTGLNRG
ncbi:MAG: cytochrome c [Actinobacteria bacterium]|nr:MAG: cytochrome c [Actinomycetota bacterium]